VPSLQSHLWGFRLIGGIKYKKSTIRNQSISGFFKTSHLNNGGFAYIWYPLISGFIFLFLFTWLFFFSLSLYFPCLIHLELVLILILKTINVNFSFLNKETNQQKRVKNRK
jgi:hypothetical protein